MFQTSRYWKLFPAVSLVSTALLVAAGPPPFSPRTHRAVVKIQKDVQHPQTKQQVRVEDAQAMLQLLPNPKNDALVEARIILESTGKGQATGNPHRLGGVCSRTVPRAKEFPRLLPMDCPVHFVSEKQHGRVPAFVVFGDLIETREGMLLFSVKRILVP